MSVNVIIPALNEPYLEDLLKQLNSYHVDVRGEFGLSFAVWRGIQESKDNIIVVMDADGSHSPEAIPDMVKLLNKETWLVVGSRYCEGGHSQDPTVRQIISRFYCLFAQIFLKTRIRDSMSGFWVGYKRAFNFVPSKTYKFGLQLVRNHKSYIREYPITFFRRKKGKSHVKPLQALQDLLAIFRR